MKVLKYHIGLLLVCISYMIQAQTPCFTLNVSRGCEPLTVNVIDCSGSSSVVYWYGEGSQNYIPATNYTFDTAGIYTIIQLISIPGGSDTTSLNVEVLPAPSPIFEVSVCEDTSANVYITDLNYEEYIVDFGDGFIDTVLSTSLINHKYLTLGLKTITVTGNYVPGNCGGSSSQTIPLINELLQPQITSLSQDSTHYAKITFTTQKNVIYAIEVSKNDSLDFQILDSVLANSSNQELILPLDTGNQFCYRIKAYDLCGNSNYSTIICLILPKIVAVNNYNQVSWKKYAGLNFASFSLFKDSVFYTSTSINQDYVINDSSTFCGIKSCYYLTTLLSGGFTIHSKDSCVIGISDKVQDSLFLLTSYNNSNDIQLLWDNPEAPISSFKVFKDGNLLTETKDTSLITQKSNSCYSI